MYHQARVDPSQQMVSFASVPRYLQATGRAFTLAPDADLLQCRVDDQQVSAIVAMRGLISRAGSEWLAVSVPICRAGQIGLRAALVANDELPVGALALREGVVLLRQTLPLAGLAFEQFEHALRALVRTTALLVRTMATMAADPDREMAYRYLFR
jgi:hypothetical protein